MNIVLALRVIGMLAHIAYGVLTCALVFPWIGDTRRDRLVQRWSRRLLAICGVEVRQGPGAPALAHALVVANHVSWLDIFVINALQPCRFVAKSEIRSWPLLGWLVHQAGTVFIVRGNRRDLRHIFKSLVQSLKAGQRVAFFPEGTTAAQGQLLPFHANLFEAAIDAAIPVQPYALHYFDAHGAPHRAVDFIGDMTLAQSIVAILSGAPIRAQLSCLAPIDAGGAHRRELARAAHAAVADALDLTLP